MKILYFDCFSGISGDMTLAALIDLGFPREKLEMELGKLGLSDYELKLFRGSRSGIAATGLEVKVREGKEHPHRHFSHIRRMIAESALEEEVKAISLKIFHRLAEGEAGVHGQKIEEVHFHEVGAVDSIVDIVGTAIGVQFFRPEKILSSDLPMGRGFVECQHGRLPLPAPATVEILKGYPVKNVPFEGELVTPTGAAIVSSLSTGVTAFPSMKMDRVGYGMGKMEFPDRPNLLRLVTGEATDFYERDHVIVIESNIDDMNPEFYGFLMEKLYDLGALDVSLNPLIMKKNRPGTLLRVIAEEKDSEMLAEAILRESTTLGVRLYGVARKKLPRQIKEVETAYGKVRVKVSGGMRFQPEYEDCKRIALEKGIPIQDVYQAVLKKRE
jgi:uncharacterized protein (TIGR00299 family) protein